jgi:hypothetical protein
MADSPSIAPTTTDAPPTAEATELTDEELAKQLAAQWAAEEAQAASASPDDVAKSSAGLCWWESCVCVPFDFVKVSASAL